MLVFHSCNTKKIYSTVCSFDGRFVWALHIGQKSCNTDNCK